MADINRTVLVGRLTRDCELKYTPNTNLPVTKLSIAVNSRRKQDNEWVDDANFFDITLFGKQGEALNKYLLKGKQIAIEGQLRQDRWEQDGQTRSRVHIIADNIMLLAGNSNEGNERNTLSSIQRSNQNSPPLQEQSNKSKNIAPPVDFEDDIPF